MILLVAGILIIVFAIWKWKDNNKKELDLISQFFPDKVWSLEGDDDNDVRIHRFAIDIPDSQLKKLNNKISLTRYPTASLSNMKFHYGMRDHVMEDLLKYWRKEYSWRTQEKMMNTFGHFKTRIEGLQIHFIHETPPDTYPYFNFEEQASTVMTAKKVIGMFKPSAGAGDYDQLDQKVILCIHGWPGSFVEYLEMIPMLTNPVEHGGNETDAFTVVVPSIPGFGFSDAPEREGFNVYECARVFHKLMLRLGHKKYYVQGGDYGAMISNAMSLMYPSCIQGCYTTMATVAPQGFFGILKVIVGSYFPRLLYSSEEAEKIFPFKSTLREFVEETGYMHLHATKPDTVGFALSDSPVGLAAYILEKFSSWTDMNGKDMDGGLLWKYWTENQLLDNIMIYWWSENVTSSLRLYKETMANPTIIKMNRLKIRVPYGFGWFPNEFVVCAKTWLKPYIPNLIHFTYMKEGGHFNAFQVPAALCSDVRLFVQTVEKREKENKQWAKSFVTDVKASHLDRLHKKTQ